MSESKRHVDVYPGASASRGRIRRSQVLLVAGAMLASLFAALPAHAADSTQEGTVLPQTVSADVLPTPQINGVVWSTAVNGNTAYAVGSFTRARPSGVAAGGAGEVLRNNAMAFEISTGKILPWNPNLNAQGKEVEISPDKTQIFVGGDFSAVGGQPRSKIATFDLGTGALQSFGTSVGGQVETISVTGSTVYIGGSFGSAGGQPRQNVAALNRSNGALLPWAPAADSIVHGVIASADNSRVVIGGRFQNLNGERKIGIGAVNGITGASLPWSSTPIPQTRGVDTSWVTQMIEKDGVVYAGANGMGGHWFDGRFAADFATGDLIWMDNCYGSTSDIAVMDQVMYSVSHAHDCSSLGEFPEEDPQVWKRALAETTFATGTDQAPPGSNSTYSGQPVPTLLHWYPALNTGFFTGQYQGGWALANNDTYLVAGGEFTTVNGVAQQGLAVFASRTVAPNKIRPEYTADLKPSTVSLSAGSVRVAWPTTWDYDDATLTYEVLRDNSLTAIATLNEPSIWWKKKSIGFIDTGRTPGATHTYRIRVKDPAGNEYIGPRSAPVTVAATAPNAYGDVIKADGASTYYPLNETSGTVAFDHAGFNDGDAGDGVTRPVEGAMPGDTAAGFSGAGTASIATRNFAPAPDTFSLETWFQTTSTRGGKIAGYGNTRTGDSGSYDRHVWMDNSGRLWFGTWLGYAATVNSSKSYNDGQWHQLTATLGPQGMVLYVDGVRVADRSDVTSGQKYGGYWRIGGDNLNGWPSQPSSSRFTGNLDDVAIYPTVLDRLTVANHYRASGRTPDIAPVPTDGYGAAVYADDPSLYWRLEDASGPTAADTSLYGNPARVAGGVTVGVPGVISGPGGKAFAFDGASGMAAASSAVNNPRVYSAEAWFKTGTVRGGKIIGFGNSNTGLSNSYDRHVYMRDDGKLTFGTYTGAMNTITTALPYNDDKWHHVVATQSGAGMKLYVDGMLTGSHPQTAAEPYTGYWRIGGDRVWDGASSGYFAGTIDEAAVYSTSLTLEQVQAHYAFGGTLNKAPVADFTSVVDGKNVVFDARDSSDADGRIVAYSWDFGDGTTGEGAGIQHLYNEVGTFTVTLTVKDDGGATASKQAEVTTVRPNAAPTAALTSTSTGLRVSFDATGSADSDGTIAGYAWDFGDGSTGTGVDPVHRYAAGGEYQVTLTVTDNDGASAAATVQLVVANAEPSAVFSFSTDGLDAAFDAGGSDDPDGGVSGYAWDFGDGSTGSGKTVSHRYAQAGTYEAVLTVTDDLGARSTASQSVTVNVPEGPGAVFSKEVTGRTIRLDASGSGSPNGTVTGYAWDFGDGERAAGATVSHAFAADGTYTVTLVVTGSNGGTSSYSEEITVANAAPVAVYQSTADGLNVAFDAAGSSDPDGTVESYAWDFGDGSQGTGATVEHQYGASGDYEVTLTVTDNAGAEATVTGTVSVEGSQGPLTYAQDSFGRNATGGWGQADQGGAWQRLGSAANLSVTDGQGKLRMGSPGAGPRVTLPGVEASDTEIAVQLGNDKAATGGGVYNHIVVREVPDVGRYEAAVRFRASGQVAVSLYRVLNGVETFIANETVISGLTIQPGDLLNARVQATGTSPTQIRFKIWGQGSSEPGQWQLTAADSTSALQVPGRIGLGAYLSGSATNAPVHSLWDNLWVGQTRAE
ncbi:PKD domain-containing protein [Arthrobacter sp. CAU 1506]|uniref:LamG domain-containing protein n=1 Tax=Arthrobacter sp. CAU 1506 TaxID=2560052 RepID=UPI0010AC570C|nr:LamG domain-containing protein [Arthrobacter sp. CAU 1506]TJY72355.1 PKD domain-containing protein [Arthrobacter sp. CAU 1506]